MKKLFVLLSLVAVSHLSSAAPQNDEMKVASVDTENGFQIPFLYYHYPITVTNDSLSVSNVNGRVKRSATLDTFWPLWVWMGFNEPKPGYLFVSPLLGVYGDSMDRENDMKMSFTVLPTFLFGSFSSSEGTNSLKNVTWALPLFLDCSKQEGQTRSSLFWTPLYDAFDGPGSHGFGLVTRILASCRFQNNGDFENSYLIWLFNHGRRTTTPRKGEVANARESSSVVKWNHFLDFPMDQMLGVFSLDGGVLGWSTTNDELDSFQVAPLWRWTRSGTCLTPLGGKRVSNGMTDTWYSPLLKISHGKSRNGVTVWPLGYYSQSVGFDRDEARLASTRLSDERKFWSGTEFEILFGLLADYSRSVKGGIQDDKNAKSKPAASNTSIPRKAEYKMSDESSFKLSLAYKQHSKLYRWFDVGTRECVREEGDWSYSFPLDLLYWKGSENKAKEGKCIKDEFKFSLGWILNYQSDTAKDMWRNSLLGDFLSCGHDEKGVNAHLLFIKLF